MRKKVDDRIRTLIDNGVKLRHRSMFVTVGDKSRDQIVNLNYMLSKSSVNARPNVLWCYKDKLELSSHRKKRAKQVKKLLQRGLLDPEKVDPFSLFVESGNITYCLYKDSERVLGNTFGMCILQDFEAVTPNLLARTIETVAGGGLVILLLRSLPSLTSLYAMTMILDLLPILAYQYFQEKIPVSLTSVQASVLFCMGMQHKDISCIKKEMVSKEGEGFKHEMILSLFSQAMKKLYIYLYEVAANEIDSIVPRLKEESMIAGNDREGDF